jgi:glycine/D-amino acid oxidase-like deaminating enzyme
MTRPDRLDCIVIGAGIVGVMIAHAMAQARPDWRIAVLDRSLAAGGASRFSAGLHIPYGRSRRLRLLSAASEAAYRALVGGDPELPITPVLLVGFVSAARVGAEVERFTRHVVIEPHPAFDKFSIGDIVQPLGTTAIAAGGSHYADVGAVAAHLVRGMRAGGTVRVWEGVEVAALNADTDGVDILLSDGRTLLSRCAVVAPGPWACGGPFAPLAATFGIRIKKVVALHIDIAPRDGDGAVYFFDDGAFLLPLHRRGHWLFSYTCREWHVTPDAGMLGITAADRREALSILDRYCPRLRDRCGSGRAFCDAYSPGGEPVVARAADRPNLVFAGAANGAGYRLAPGIAAEALDLVTDVLEPVTCSRGRHHANH